MQVLQSSVVLGYFISPEACRQVGNLDQCCGCVDGAFGHSNINVHVARWDQGAASSFWC